MYFVAHQTGDGDQYAVTAGSLQQCRGTLNLLEKRFSAVVRHRDEWRLSLRGSDLDDGKDGSEYKIVGGIDDDGPPLFHLEGEGTITGPVSTQKRYGYTDWHINQLRDVDVGETVYMQGGDPATGRRFTRLR